jgi:hypothetical protein
MLDVAIGHIRHLEATLQKRKRELLLATDLRGAGSSSAPPPYAGQVPVLPQGFWTGSSPAPPPDARQVLLLPESWLWVPKKKKAAARPIGFQSWAESDIVLNVTGDNAFVAVCTAQRPGLLLLVLSVLERHHIEVISAQISSNVNRTMFNLYTRVSSSIPICRPPCLVLSRGPRAFGCTNIYTRCRHRIWRSVDRI